MHLGMLEAIEIRMEIVSGNFRCLSISNCGFPAPDEGRLGRGGSTLSLKTADRGGVLRFVPQGFTLRVRIGAARG